MSSLTSTVIGLLFLSGAGIVYAQTFDFKGIVLGSNSSINMLQEQHGLKNCQPAWHNGSQIGVFCNGKTTILGKDGSLRVLLSNEGRVTSIYVTYKADPIKRTIIFDDMKKALSQKFGPPKRQGSGVAYWFNAQGHVVEFTSSHLDMRGGRSAPDPKLNEKEKKDL